MRWSQLKQRVEEKFASRVRGRIKLFQTRYRGAADSFGEAWIILDGKRRFSWGDIAFIEAEGAAYSASYYKKMSAVEANKAVLADLEARGALMRWQLNALLLESLSLSIESMLKHRSPIIRGLALLDRRFGKRRLIAFDIETEHPFVRLLFEFRCTIEGVRPRNIRDSISESNA